MHISLLVLIDPAPFDELEPGVEELERLTQALGSRPHLPAAVHVSARLLEHVAESRSELARALAGLNVEWVRTGWGEPDYGAVPGAVAKLAFDEEAATLGRLDLMPGAAFVRHRWVDRLTGILSDSGVPSVLLARTLADSPSPGAIVSFDRIIPAAVVTAPSTPSELSSGDDLAVWAILASELERTADQIRDAPGHVLAYPSECLSTHGVRGRLRVHESPYVPPSPEIDLLWRKHVRLATRLGERPDSRAVRLLLDAAHTTYLTDASRPWERVRAHSSLIEARAILDDQRRRGDDRAGIARLDWDADGGEEIQIELPELSLVIDPADGARLLVADDKVQAWPMGYIPDVEPGSLCRLDKGNVCFELDRMEEGRSDVTLEFVSPKLRCRMVATDRQLTLSYEATDTSGTRFGPELLLAVGEARVRVDGGEWLSIADEVMLSGHRFRIDGSDRQVLLVAMMPTDVRISPASGGVVVWPSWQAGTGGKYGVTVDFAP